MATIFTSDGDLQLFVPGDIYRYDYDNRPLRRLLLNDIAINNELIVVKAEVEGARQPLLLNGGAPYAQVVDYLHDLESGAGLPAKIAAYSQFRGECAARAERYPSGFVAPVGDVYQLRELIDLSNATDRVVPFPLFASPSWGKLLLRDWWASGNVNQLTLGDGFDPIVTRTAGVLTDVTYNKRTPVPLFVAGMLVRLWEERSDATLGATARIAWDLGAAPVGANAIRVQLCWIEVWLQNVPRTGTPTFKSYGASNTTNVTDVSSPLLWGTVGFHGGNGGDYFQVRHRLRVSTVSNADLHQFGFTDTANVFAQGGNVAPMGAGPYSNFLPASLVAGQYFSRDAGLWVAGNGSGASATAQGSVDGYVYGVPVALVFRRNSTPYNEASNQNGAGVAWASNSTVSDRPDGKFHNRIEVGDVVPIAPSSVSGRTDLSKILDETTDRLLRGELRTRHGYKRYWDGVGGNWLIDLHEENGYPRDQLTSASEPIGGSSVSSIVKIDGTAFVAEKCDRVFEDAPGTTVAAPDGFRRVFSHRPETQVVGFTVTNVSGTTCKPDNFLTYDVGAKKITFYAGGVSVGSPYAIIETAPTMWWPNAVAVSVVSTNGLGTDTVEVVINTSGHTTDPVVGFIDVRFAPTFGGNKHPISETVCQVFDPAFGSPIQSQQIDQRFGDNYLMQPNAVAAGLDGVLPVYFVTDEGRHSVFKFNGNTGSLMASYGGILNLNAPTAVAVDGSSNVYVTDHNNNRIVKLDVNLALIGTYTLAGPEGPFTDLRGIAVDGSGNVYVSDAFRIVKLDPTFLFLAQFGEADVPGMDSDHCVFPRHIHFHASGSQLWIADTARIIVLSSTSMTVDAFLEPGESVPVFKDNSSQVLDPARVWAVREDGSGNKYVLHSAPDEVSGSLEERAFPITLLSKYDSSWNFVGRVGSSNDSPGRYGGMFYGNQAEGIPGDARLLALTATHAYVMAVISPNDYIDPAVSVMRQVETNVIRAYTLAGFPALSSYSLTSVYDSGVANVVGPVRGNRPNSGYSTLPIGERWPRWKPVAMAFDSDQAVRRFYILSSGPADDDLGQTCWQRIERWNAAGDDPATWTFEAFWGTMDRVPISSESGEDMGYGWRAWGSSLDDPHRLLSVSDSGNGMVLVTGAANATKVFIADNHSVIRLLASGFNGSGDGGYDGRFGTAGVPGGTKLADNTHLNFHRFGAKNASWTSLAIVGTGPTDATGYLYVSDVGNERILACRYDGVWPPAITPTQTTASNIGAPPFDAVLAFVGGSNPNLSKRIWCRSLGASTKRETLECSGVATVTVTVPTLANGARTTYVPSDRSKSKGDPRTHCIHGVSGITVPTGTTMVWSDSVTGQLVAVNETNTPSSYYMEGECGTPHLGAKDHANFNQVTGLASFGTLTSPLIVVDDVGKRLLVVSTRYAHVQPGSGRIEFLVAPEVNSSWKGYTEHVPYQGVILRGKPTKQYTVQGVLESYDLLSGAQTLVPPRKVIVTTLGEGDIEALSTPGLWALSNMAGRLPYVFEFDPTAPSGLAPTDFSLSCGTPRAAHHEVPVLSIAPNPKGFFRGENVSFWDPRTRLINSTLVSPDPLRLSRGGITATWVDTGRDFWTPLTDLFPRVSTFPCIDPPPMRLVIVPFLVSYEGEVLVALRCRVFTASSKENSLGGNPFRPIVETVELYRAHGHPMVKETGETMGAINGDIFS